MGTEIERKFLVSDLPPDLDGSHSDRIEQGYIAITDDELEVRVRRRGSQAVLTVKKGEGRKRLEEEIEIADEGFERLWPLTEGRRLEKTRYVVPISGGLELEIDVYAGELEGLVTAEVELPSEEAAERFEPPSWLGPEVSDDPHYKNQWLACHGKPS